MPIKVFSLLVLAVFMGGSSLRAEDWTMPDGTVYQNVSVVKEEPDAVTILHHDGGGRIPLGKLPPQLQERFHYNAATAQAAATAREAQAQTEALLAQAQQMADAALRRAAAADSTPAPSNSASGGAASTVSDHHTVGELSDSMHTLQDTGNPTHYSMGGLANSLHSL